MAIIGDKEKLLQKLNSLERELLSSFIDTIKSKKIGEWYNLINEDFKVIVLDSCFYEKNIFESHKKYEDIHFVIKGEDEIFLSSKFLERIKEYDEDLDFSLYKGENSCRIILKKNMYCLIDIKELHSNNFKKRKTIKIVIKRKK